MKEYMVLQGALNKDSSTVGKGIVSSLSFLDLWDCVEDLVEALEVPGGGAGAAGGVGQRLGVLRGELLPRLQRVVLVQARVAAVLKWGRV